MSDPAPYQKIANELREKIFSGELAPGDHLPSELLLAKNHGVTRNTAGRAIKQLRAEGLVVTTQGARPTVRTRPRLRHIATGKNFREQQATGKPNDIAEAEAQGYPGANDLPEVGEVPAPPEVAKLLKVEAGALVITRYQLNRAAGEPMKTVRCYYRRDFASGTPLAEARKIGGGVASLIEAEDGPFRRVIAEFTEDVEVRMPTPNEAQLLLIPPGVPVARILRTMLDVSGEALEVLDSLLPGDRYLLHYEIAIPEKP